MLRRLDIRVILGGISLVIGIALLYIFGQQYELNCTRPVSNQPDCTQERSWLGTIPLSSRSIEGLSSAQVGQVCDTEGCVHWVDLRTAADSIKLDEFDSSRVGPKEEIAEDINAFLGDPSIPELEVKVSSGATGRLLIVLFIGAGLVSFASLLISRLRRSSMFGSG